MVILRWILPGYLFRIKRGRVAVGKVDHVVGRKDCPKTVNVKRRALAKDASLGVSSKDRKNGFPQAEWVSQLEWPVRIDKIRLYGNPAVRCPVAAFTRWHDERCHSRNTFLLDERPENHSLMSATSSLKNIAAASMWRDEAFAYGTSMT